MLKKIKDDVINILVPRIMKKLPKRVQKLFGPDITYHVNPTGKFVIGGPHGDTGLTGRKIVVDSYGPRVPIGGGAFSSKDASKVDRSGAYMARKIAVDYLKLYEAKEVFVQLAYAIGEVEPLEATAIVDGREFQIIEYDLTPNGIIKFLDLKKPQFAETAKWGHFGHPDLFLWDR